MRDVIEMFLARGFECTHEAVRDWEGRFAPLTRRHQGVLLVNPGAIASSSASTRQRVQTVALLFLRDDGGACVVHADLAAPERAFVPRIDWEAGFSAALDKCSASIVGPDLTADRESLVRDVPPLAPAEVRALVLRVAHCCWSGQQEVLAAFQ